MAAPRFFHLQLPPSGEVVLSDSEARHASKVLRLAAGAEIVLFDGQGGEASGTITALNKRSVVVEIETRTDSNRELAQSLELVVALPKGDRQKTLVEGLVQLGVTRLTPLVCQRGVAQPTATALERLERSVVESSKQCGRNQLMHISPPMVISQVLQSSTEQSTTLSLVAHPYGPATSLAAMDHEFSSQIIAARIAVGPEGGFSDVEISQWLEAGWQCVELGPRLLRVEMAALQLAAWWACYSELRKKAGDPCEPPAIFLS
ncbi:MAG: RsmE family RNA methyltransferase [Aureliella sp.]